MGGEAAISGTRDAGDRGERAAALDLVARDRDGAVCFVEVKLRSTRAIGLPREFVDGRKQERLRKTAMAYLVESGMEDAPARFDVAEVYAPQGADTHKPLIQLVENAF